MRYVIIFKIYKKEENNFSIKSITKRNGLLANNNNIFACKKINKYCFIFINLKNKFYIYRIYILFFLIIYILFYVIKKIINLFFIIFYLLFMGIGDWGLGIGDWGLGPIPNPQSPIPNPQSPIPKKFHILLNFSFFEYI